MGAEDVVGQVPSLNTTNNTFSIQNVAGSFPLVVDSNSTFFQFPINVCTTSAIACLRTNQIVSVDMRRSEPMVLWKQRNVVFERMPTIAIRKWKARLRAQMRARRQFNIVVHAISGTGTGLSIGQVATVTYAVAPQTPFAIDFGHADNTQIPTAGFLFATPADLSVGQEVSIRRNSSSSGVLHLLRIAYCCGCHGSLHRFNRLGLLIFFMSNLPSIFSGNSVTQDSGADFHTDYFL